MNFPEKDKIFLSLQSSLSKNSKVVIAFSGGPDSAFLLHVLKDFYTSKGWNEQNLILAHFNHGQRSESNKEQQIIFNKYNTHHIYYNPIKPKKGLKETELRTHRLEFLDEVIKSEKAHYIATGHNLDDRIETSLLNLIRGTSLHGLANMTIADTNKKHIILRPLLILRKSYIKSLCDKNTITYFLDPTNTDPDYTSRNMLRNRIIPSITTLLPQGDEKRYDSRRLIYEQIETAPNVNIPLISRPTHPSRKATYCYEIGLKPKKITQSDRANIFSHLAVGGSHSQKTLAEWTRFSNTSNDGHKEIGGIYFFISHGRVYVIDGKKEFRKKSPSPADSYAKEGDTYKGKRLKKRMINQKIPLFRRNFIQVERQLGKITKVFDIDF